MIQEASCARRVPAVCHPYWTTTCDKQSLSGRFGDRCKYMYACLYLAHSLSNIAYDIYTYYQEQVPWCCSCFQRCVSHILIFLHSPNKTACCCPVHELVHFGGRSKEPTKREKHRAGVLCPLNLLTGSRHCTSGQTYIALDNETVETGSLLVKHRGFEGWWFGCTSTGRGFCGSHVGGEAGCVFFSINLGTLLPMIYTLWN